MRLSMIIPAQNEEENLGVTLANFVGIAETEDLEIIVVDDHSKDNTFRIAKEFSDIHPQVRVVKNDKNPGFANALLTGFHAAKGEFVLPVMADNCDDPSTIPLMLEKISLGYDIVCGSRYMKGGKKYRGPFIQGFFSRCVGLSLYTLAHIPTHDISNAFKAYRKSILLSLDFVEEGFAISMEASLRFLAKGAVMTEVPTIWRGRKKGVSKFKIRKTFPYIRLFFTAFRKKWISQ